MGAEQSTASASSSEESKSKRSLYRRYEDAKSGRDRPVSDEDLKKYTGMTKYELGEWSKDRPGVGPHKNDGDITTGPVTGFGGMASAGGYGGWGLDARGDLKFPPQPQKGKADDGRGDL